jgi:hypothetical protein
LYFITLYDDDLQVRDLREVRQNFVLNTASEERVLLILAPIFKWQDCNTFVWCGIQRRILDPRWLKDEKCRHAENDDGCDCESEADASRALCVWRRTLQARC